MSALFLYYCVKHTFIIFALMLIYCNITALKEEDLTEADDRVRVKG